MASYSVAATVLTAALRLLLSYLGASEPLRARVEVGSPLTAFDRVCEAKFLFESNLDPYQGWAAHQPPVLMVLLWPLCGAPDWLWLIVSTAVDVLTAICISKAVHAAYAPVGKRAPAVLQQAGIIYLLNPLMIAGSVGRSIGGFHNAGIAAALMFALQGSAPLATFSLAVAANMALYPVILIFPLMLLLQQRFQIQYSVTMAMFVIWTSALLGTSFYAFDSWGFMHHVYMFTLTAPDLTPNIGMWWYFFTEMFTSFRPFFSFVFQYVFLFHVGGICIRFKQKPLFVFLVSLIIVTTFKSYPTYTDIALYLSLLPVQSHIVQLTRNSFVIGNVFVYPLILAPLLWHHWVTLGAGNANFYWATCLVLCLTQVWLVVDLLSAAVTAQRLEEGKEVE